MTAMEGGNAIGLPGATLAHCHGIIILNQLLINGPIAVPKLPSVIVSNGYRRSDASVKSGMTSGVFIEFRN